MSVRKIKKSYISCTGYFASYKNKTQIAFESVLERDFYMMLEFDNDVASYTEQPVSINYTYKDGSKRKYTPDCLVRYKDGTKRYFEVKYASEIKNNPELKEKIEFLKSYFYDEYVLKFDVFTDEDVGEVYLDNLKILYKFAFMKDDEEKLSKINDILNNVSSIKVYELLERLDKDKNKQLYWLPHIWRYVFKRTDVVKLHEKLTNHTILCKEIGF